MEYQSKNSNRQEKQPSRMSRAVKRVAKGTLKAGKKTIELGDKATTKAMSLTYRIAGPVAMTLGLTTGGLYLAQKPIEDAINHYTGNLGQMVSTGRNLAIDGIFTPIGQYRFDLEKQSERILTEEQKLTIEKEIKPKLETYLRETRTILDNIHDEWNSIGRVAEQSLDFIVYSGNATKMTIDKLGLKVLDATAKATGFENQLDKWKNATCETSQGIAKWIMRKQFSEEEYKKGVEEIGECTEEQKQRELKRLDGVRSQELNKKSSLEEALQTTSDQYWRKLDDHLENLRRISQSWDYQGDAVQGLEVAAKAIGSSLEQYNRNKDPQELTRALEYWKENKTEYYLEQLQGKARNEVQEIQRTINKITKLEEQVGKYHHESEASIVQFNDMYNKAQKVREYLKEKGVKEEAFRTLDEIDVQLDAAFRTINQDTHIVNMYAEEGMDLKQNPIMRQSEPINIGFYGSWAAILAAAVGALGFGTVHAANKATKAIRPYVVSKK